MKINLLLDNPGDVRSGYLNIDPFTPDNTNDTRVKCDITNLDPVVEAAEAQEIVAHDILDYFQPDMADTILRHWISKLAHGGKLCLSTVDLKEVCRSVATGQLSVEDANDLLHGIQQRGWDLRRSTFHLSQIVEVLQTLGLKVQSKRIRNHHSFVVVERP